MFSWFLEFRAFQCYNNKIVTCSIIRLSSKHFCLQPFSLQRFSIFTVCLVDCLHEVSPGEKAKEKSMKFRSPDCWKMHFRHSFWLQWISVENTYILSCLQIFFLSAAAAIFVGVSWGVLKKNWQERYKQLCVFVSI